MPKQYCTCGHWIDARRFCFACLGKDINRCAIEQDRKSTRLNSFPTRRSSDLAIEHGFTPPDKGNVLGKLMLVVTEVSEAAEATRIGDWENFAEELADVLIRVLQIGYGLDIDLESAVWQKIKKNELRPYRHSGKTS